LRSPEALLIDRIATPIGEMILVADADGRLRAIDWTDTEARFRRLLARHCGANATLTPARDPAGLGTALRCYFEGEIGVLDALAVATAGTAFQRRVWLALRGIPAGTTVSYGALALRIGQAAAVRAVGLANGRNPVGIVVPCHRVIGADGSLTGYGGGLDRKHWLLAHERTYGSKGL
jgi:methylated-DNA-[protein]-cysteine S-methyltransferase